MRKGSVQVRSKTELESAIDEGVAGIEVRGELAETLRKAVQMRNVSRWTLRLLSLAIVAMPFTGGVSGLAAASLATLTGLDIALIIAVASLGIILVLAILKDYEVVDFSAKRGDMEAQLHLRRKSE